MAETHAVVTTFSERGYNAYGRIFIDTFELFWPKDVALYVYYEGEKPQDANRRASWISLDADEDRRKFMATHTDIPEVYQQCPVRYSHKVFALTSAPRDADYLMFLDGDCETFATVTPELLNEICPDPGQIGSYLGRPYFRHSETGFTAYRKNNCADDFLNEFRRQYTSGDFSNLPELHDSMVYDYVRKKFERAGHRFKNICKDSSGLNVFPQSPLGKFIHHHKGAKKKERRYGDHVLSGITVPISEFEKSLINAENG